MKLKILPEEGEIRTRRVFIWFPKNIGTHIAWLEFYTLIEQYRRLKVPLNIYDMKRKYKWIIKGATFYDRKGYTCTSYSYNLDENSELYKLNK